MNDFAREYGDGLYDLARDEQLEDELMDQLKVLKDVFRAEPDYLRLLSNRAIGIEDRMQMLDDILRDRAHPYILNFLKLLCRRDALSEFDGCVQAYTNQYNEDSRVAVANVTTAEPLSASQREKMIEKLKKMTGRKIVLNEKTDPQLLGGVVLEMDGHRWDNSILHRLNGIREAIAGED